MTDDLDPQTQAEAACGSVCVLNESSGNVTVTFLCGVRLTVRPGRWWQLTGDMAGGRQAAADGGDRQAGDSDSGSLTEGRQS